jgi:GTP cyclohydrolase FolE2
MILIKFYDDLLFEESRKMRVRTRLIKVANEIAKVLELSLQSLFKAISESSPRNFKVTAFPAFVCHSQRSIVMKTQTNQSKDARDLINVAESSTIFEW